MTETYLEKSRRAFTLHKKGKSNVEIKVELGLGYASDAEGMVAVGRIDAVHQEAALTSDELKLILSIAAAERSALEEGDSCSPKIKYCGGWRWSHGKADRVAKKRLNLFRKNEDKTKGSWSATGLNLVDTYNGGYVRLTRAGWALVHALEAKLEHL